MNFQANKVSRNWINPAKVSQIAFGIRYQSHYTISDFSGSILDRVLHANRTPFGSDIFPVTQKDLFEHHLVHPANESLLRLGPQDTLLRLPIDTNDVEVVQSAAEDFENFILEPIREITNLGNILRYGFVLQLDCKTSDLLDSPINLYVPKEFSGANNLVMRFTKRLPAEEGLFKERVEDYRNVIYTIEESDKGAVRLSLDFQLYFKPALTAEDWKTRSFPKFVDQGLKHFQKEFKPWFQQFRRLSEVA